MATETTGQTWRVVLADGGVREVPVTQPLKAGFRYATAADIKTAKAKAAALDAADGKAPPKPTADGKAPPKPTAPAAA